MTITDVTKFPDEFKTSARLLSSSVLPVQAGWTLAVKHMAKIHLCGECLLKAILLLGGKCWAVKCSDSDWNCEGGGWVGGVSPVVYVLRSSYSPLSASHVPLLPVLPFISVSKSQHRRKSGPAHHHHHRCLHWLDWWKTSERQVHR